MEDDLTGGPAEQTRQRNSDIRVRAKKHGLAVNDL
jgi:hypothetical protein